MGIAIILARFFPDIAASGGVIRSEYSIQYGAVAAIFLISGLSISTGTFVSNFSKWQAHLLCQSLSFVITPAITSAFAVMIKAAGNSKIDLHVLVGVIITGCTPTTVSSNVVMTKAAGGNHSLSVVEVLVGNMLGAFVSPALVQLYVSKWTGFGFANPARNSKVSYLYASVMKHLGFSLFLPLFVGQGVQLVFPKQVKWTVAKFKMGKISSLCLLLLIWATFSTAFHEGAFRTVPPESVVFICFLNIALYLLFTILCFIGARSPVYKLVPVSVDKSDRLCRIRSILKGFHFDRKDTVAIMLCGAAKTVALGSPLIVAQYGDSSPFISQISIPLILYQGEQVLVAQLLIPLMKRWIDRE